ncbi:hypothetical protein COLE_00095 [Cutaneotrichosporon oleaginosum]|nr:hypothetical protein COLE_00095 [Cutaneotrichosporon oleaginosum]
MHGYRVVAATWSAHVVIAW